MLHKKLTKLSPRFIGLRGKLLLVTLTLFILPIAGLSYLKELELFLKNNHSESVIVIAKTIASLFRDNASLIALNQRVESPQKALYSHPIKSSITLDGYSDDWFALQNTQYHYKKTPSATDISMSLRCANDDDDYYFLLTVHKQRKIPKNTFVKLGVNTVKHPDIINFQYLDYAHKIQEHHFKLDSPGRVEGEPHHIQGKWQENHHGYTLEFKIPIHQINHHIAFQLRQQNELNEDTLTTNSETLITPRNPTYQLNPLISVDPLSVLRLQQIIPENTQLWLLNRQQYVSANAKKLATPSNGEHQELSLLSLYRRLYLIIMDFPEQRAFYGRHQTKISNDATLETLNGKTAANWLDIPHSNQLNLSVATPVVDSDNRIIGTLLLEQSNEALLALQDKTFERILFFNTYIVFQCCISPTLFFNTLTKKDH